jgi:NAD(P)-dependent dehydrogenase (short-subunit alcohol dehydrogenase family)
VRLGAAIAERLASDGHDVVIHCNRSTRDAETLATRLRTTYGIRTAVVSRDLSGDVGDLVQLASIAIGSHLQVLVNSASVFENDSADALDADDLSLHLDVNLKAPLLLSSSFARQADHGACVVNILDQCVLRPNPWHFSYTVSKNALHSATKTMALAFAGRGIRVNAVAPGLALVNPHQDQEDYRRCIESLPLKRGGSPDEIARAVSFLVSMPSVTGLCMTVDGGQHLAGDTPGVDLDRSMVHPTLNAPRLVPMMETALS